MFIPIWERVSPILTFAYFSDRLVTVFCCTSYQASLSHLRVRQNTKACLARCFFRNVHWASKRGRSGDLWSSAISRRWWMEIEISTSFVPFPSFWYHDWSIGQCLLSHFPPVRKWRRGGNCKRERSHSRHVILNWVFEVVCVPSEVYWGLVGFI